MRVLITNVLDIYFKLLFQRQIFKIVFSASEQCHALKACIHRTKSNSFASFRHTPPYVDTQQPPTKGKGVIQFPCLFDCDGHRGCQL